MAHTVNEALIRDVIEDVLGRLGGSTPVVVPPPAAKPSGDNGSCGCHAKGSGGRNFGVFSTADEACDAAAKAFQQLREQGIEARRRIVEIVKSLCEDNAEEWGRIELEETKIGRLDHKIEKLQIIRNVPGVEWLRPDGLSGDHGITLEEYTPFGVVGAVTPSTHSIPTLAGNIVNIVAAGNAVVFNAHPHAAVWPRHLWAEFRGTGGSRNVNDLLQETIQRPRNGSHCILDERQALLQFIV